ncbi:hypothetical protein [Sphingopyxis macrogoltabida]|uniref:Uncharacterized protein n=1 Tax=Sphingopyxis macrogoltabida TaxID=33050 RepID=A0AAC8Z215_SPHMC|nr:hypothetical protein [Sphingopyxis macrogoltabida]ALJ14244.1 hypothetical protein LH19_15345 [Sphingopyxis macrogoltabida]AMU90510.1 hypothetical protein ATM17_15920 [Sphingopyxis macrogoltabida]
MTRAKPTRAEQLRRHREIFTYALAHGLTLLEAEAAMARDSARAARERLALVKRCGRSAVAAPAPIGAEAPHGPAPENAPWMMRD